MASLMGHNKGGGEPVLVVQSAAANRVTHASDGGVPCEWTEREEMENGVERRERERSGR